MRNLVALMALALTASIGFAQTWLEDGDAPALLPGQTTVGTGPLTTIQGLLTSGTDVDLYAIVISDEANFSATTVGGTTIDSALYLFDEFGNGVAMSEDAQGAQSTLTSAFVTANGLYYLAMSAYDYDPLNPAGLEIWNDAPWNIERAPDGPGAPGPLANWGGSAGGSGAYRIFLTGATFAEQGPPPPQGACCFHDGSCALATAAGCAGAGGDYLGDGTSCDPNPCPPPPTGACCFAAGGCLELTPAVCGANGGQYQGDRTFCRPGYCPGAPPSVPMLFVGLQYGSLPTRTSDLAGWPNVSWSDGFAFELNGAAGRPDGALYLCSGDFSTKLYLAPPAGPAVFLGSIDKDMSALAFGRGQLWGFANYASPMGIYEINPSTGVTTLAVSTATQGYRFFALDYNPVDGLVYGYTEYGSPAGLFSINIETGVFTFIASSPPNVNGQGRGMACGNNTVYLTCTRGAEGEPAFAYNLSQGPQGTWTSFTQPFPESTATGGAAWVYVPMPGDLNCDGVVNFGDIDPFVQMLSDPAGWQADHPGCPPASGDCNADGLVDFADIDPFVALLSGG